MKDLINSEEPLILERLLESFCEKDFSTNTKTGKIWFNLQLAKKTPECLEYVILHELIHLVERNHDEKFVALMDRYMPMWREVRTTLNEQTLDYME